MKFQHLSIVIRIICLVLILPSSLVYATTYGGYHLAPIYDQMPFMKSNSNGTITINYIVHYPHNSTMNTTFALYHSNLQNLHSLTSDDLTIQAKPETINLLENNTVEYTVTAKNNIKGVFTIAAPFQYFRYPLIVGLNESEIPSSALFGLSLPIHCYEIPSDTPQIKIINYDGIILKNVTRTPDQFSPMEQIQLGSNSTDVQCKHGFDLIIKIHDNMPACVKPQTVQKLVEQGWTKMIFEKDIVINSYTPISNETENQAVKVVEIKMVPPYTPGGPVIQLTLQNIGTTPVTHLDATLEMNYNYAFNFQSITSSTPLIPSNSISNTTMLIGGGFQTESTYSLAISGMKDNMPFGYVEKVHIKG